MPSKKPNNRPSPAKAKGNPNWRRNDDDDSDDDGESDASDDAEEEVKSDESGGMSDDGAAGSATTPWTKFTKKRLWAFRTDRDEIMKSAAGLKTKLEAERATAASLRVQLGLANARLLELETSTATSRGDGAAVVYDTAAVTKLRDEHASELKERDARHKNALQEQANAHAALLREHDVLLRSALDENHALRTRDDVMFRRVAKMQRTALKTLEEIQGLRLSPLSNKVTELERERDALRKERDEYRAKANKQSRMGSLGEEAGPHMLVTVTERVRGRTPREVIRPNNALKERIHEWSRQGREWFGNQGWLWVLAYVMCSRGKAINYVLAFALPRKIVAALFDKSIRDWESGELAANIAFMTRLTTVVGRRRWDKTRRGLKFEYDEVAKRHARRTLELEHFTVKQVDDMLGRRAHDEARVRLVAKYSKVWEAQCGPIERLYDPLTSTEKADEVGAYIDVYGLVLLLVTSALTIDKYHKELKVVVKHDEHGAYLSVLVGDGCDEYPRTRKKTATEGSISLRHECGAACSPERQWPYLSVDASESSAPVTYVIAKKEKAITRLRSSMDANQRIQLGVSLCGTAKPALRRLLVAGPETPDGVVVLGQDRNFINLRVQIDYIPIFDLKHHALCYSSTGTSGIYGGIGSSVTRDNWHDPEVNICSYGDWIQNERVKAARKAGEVGADGDDPTADGSEIFFHEPAYWKKCSDAMLAHMTSFRTNNPNKTTDQLHDEALKFAKQNEHGFVKGRERDGVETFEPYSFMDVVFKCVLHLDTNFGAVFVDGAEAYSKQLSGDRKNKYSHEDNNHRKWHESLDNATMEPIADRLRNDLPWINKQPKSFRLLGPHVFALFENAGDIDAALSREDESPAEWLERNSLITMLLLHRGISCLHSKFILKKTEVHLLVEMGRYLMRLVVSLHLPMSYNLFYMCIENPQNLRRHMGRFAIDDEHVLGLQFACSQGPEAFHHDSNVRIAMQTSGRPGCHFAHMENNLLLRIASPEIVSVRFDPKGRHIHRIPDKPIKGRCRLCNVKLSDDAGCELPIGRVATNVMMTGFFVTKPLCFRCCNGRIHVFLGVCAVAGGLVQGSKCERIIATSNFIVKRKEGLVAFENARAMRIESAELYHSEQLAELDGVPNLDDVLGSTDGPGDETPGDQSDGFLVEALAPIGTPIQMMPSLADALR